MAPSLPFKLLSLCCPTSISSFIYFILQKNQIPTTIKKIKIKNTIMKMAISSASGMCPIEEHNTEYLFLY